MLITRYFYYPPKSYNNITPNNENVYSIYVSFISSKTCAED